MDIGQWLKDWATPLGAGATLIAVIVALWIGVASLIQTQRLQKRERRERLLNEIIEWAENSYKCGSEINSEGLNNLAARYFDKPHTTEDFLKELELYHFNDITELSSSFTIVNKESHYISIISFTFGQDIQSSTNKLKDALEEHIKILDRWQRVFIEPEKENNISEENNSKQNVLDSIEKLIISHKNQLHSLACQVIEKATKIKTKDIR